VVTVAAVATGGSRKQCVDNGGDRQESTIKRESLVVAAAEIEAAAKAEMVVGKATEREFAMRWRNQW